MYSNKLAKLIQEILGSGDYTLYYIDQIPSYDSAKNLDGFVAWDIDDVSPMHHTEGLSSREGNLALNFSLSIVVYDGRMSKRNELETKVLDIVQPFDSPSNRRKPLQQTQYTNGFLRYMVWITTSEFPIPKTAQSNAEMSASTIQFNVSVTL